MAAGIDRGLSTTDAQRMTCGMWIDYIIEYNNMHCPEEYRIRYATQKDFDAF